MCKFSIVIPCYNEEKYIERCLNSIFNQTIKRQEYEVIVIDDGSTDSSIEIAKKFDIKLFTSNRLGAGGARNIGIDNAKGEYIILLDADDYLYKNDVLEKLNVSLNNQDIVFVKCKRILGNDEVIIEETGTNTLEEQIYNAVHFCCTLKCFKRSIAKDIRYKERSYHEDISFTMELMCKAESLLYFNEILYVYYKEQNSSTIDNYSVEKALDFYIQTLEYLNLADKYKNKKSALIKIIEREAYVDKIKKLEDWIINDRPYSYKQFLENNTNKLKQN